MYTLYTHVENITHHLFKKVHNQRFFSAEYLISSIISTVMF